MTVQRLIELLEEIENKDLQVVCDVTTTDASQYHFVGVTNAEDVKLADGDRVCLLMKGDTVLVDEDGERVN